MEKMTKKERIQAALKKQEVDRIPINVWYHAPDVDQDPIELAELHLHLIHKYDYDFIKLMPFGNYVAQDFGLSVKFYCTPTQPAFERKFGISSTEDWKALKPLPAIYGTYGKVLQLAQYTKKFMGKEDIPFVQTIFSPLTTARKLAGPRLFDDIKKDPAAVHSALQAITETTINFVKAHVDLGISGFFFASQCSTSDMCSEATYEEFGKKYDLQVHAAYADTYFNIVHIHGPNTYFKMLSEYPAQAINWHDRWVAPNLAEARKITDKCLIGGINEKDVFETCSASEVITHISEAVAQAGTRGYIIGPGCVAHPTTPEANFFAARLAAEMLTK